MERMFLLPDRSPKNRMAWMRMITEILELIWAGVRRIVVFSPDVASDTTAILGMVIGLSPEEFEAAKQDPVKLEKMIHVAELLRLQVAVLPAEQMPPAMGGPFDDQALN